VAGLRHMQAASRTTAALASTRVPLDLLSVHNRVLKWVDFAIRGDLNT
jgi:hypothetical protein